MELLAVIVSSAVAAVLISCLVGLFAAWWFKDGGDE